jgi:hypothetical protein
MIYGDFVRFGIFFQGFYRLAMASMCEIVGVKWAKPWRKLCLKNRQITGKI